jgi:hypothetical protein
MAPTRSSRQSGADTDTSMADVSEIRQLPVDPMVRLLLQKAPLQLHCFATLLYPTEESQY